MNIISTLLSRILIASLILVVSGVVRFAPAQAVNANDLQRSFEQPPDDARIMMRWWWFGPSVTKPELEREMRLMKEGGIGGIEVQAVYPLLPDDPAGGIKNLPFLSDEFIDALRFVNAKARELGLRLDLTVGSGWPYGGAQVSIDDAAGMLRTQRFKVEGNSRRVPLPNITGGEKLLAVFLARTEGQAIVADGLQELTDIRDGAVWLPAKTEGPHEVLFFISSRTGMQVKRPAVGAEGYVLNHLDRAATENYLKTVGDRLMQAFGSNPPHAIFCDSLEAYGHDWTPDLLEEFQKRRGYDLKPYLPTLIADMGPKTQDVRYDWGRTLTELLNERFLTTIHEWSRKHRTLFRIQDYGVPAATVSSNAYVDLPEGEGPQWKVLRASRWASSASHVYGHQVTSSETWTWLHSPVFRATPLDVKAEADLHFLQGINQLIGHGWPYTPEQVEYPGWRFYAAGVWNEKNPWWIVMPDLARYLQRMSYLLRQGQPANDVALYLPNSDAWAHFTAGNAHMIETLRELAGPDVIPQVLEAGYDLDFFDDEVLKQVGHVEKGALALGPNKYRVVILPGVERIPLDTLRQLEEFVRGGGILIATRRLPQLAPGLHTTEAERNQVRELSRRLFEGSGAPAHFVENEKGRLASTLVKLLQPDMALSPSVPDIGFIHRKTSDAEIYFIANTSNMRQSVKATFRVQDLQPEWWDPMNGHVTSADVLTRAQAGTTVSLDLEPYASRVLVFNRHTLARSSVRTTSAVAAMPPIDLSTDWRVTFGQNSTPVMMDHLRSWTESEETRYFSGLATYEKELTVPESMLRDGLALRLDFGEGKPVPVQPIKAGMQTWLDPPVREAAIIYVNERRAGAVWCPPYSVDIKGLLRSGPNKIRIVVGNLALNYMAGRRLPDYRLLNLRYGERFQAQDMDKVQPITAGLLGPIRLISTADSKK
jgi:hypothetical protein